MDLAALQAFVKVVQAGSFTQAADALGTHKAQLSRVVSQLERGLGARLLERSTRALALTEVGREVFERALALLAARDDLQRVVQQSQAAPRGLLRLSCGVEFGQLEVAGWVQQYLARYPQVRVEADFTGRLVDLVHEGFDLAVRLGPLADSSLAARRLGELHYGLYAAPAYLSRQGVPAEPASLQGHAALLYAGGPAAGARRGAWRLQRGAATASPELQPRLLANNVFALRSAAIAGLGVAQLPCRLAASALATGDLVTVLPGWAPSPVPVHAVFASARYLTPKVRAFIDLAVQAMAGPQPD